MSVPKELFELIERFERNKDAYTSGQYNETQVRREFIDPLFKSLGWDVDNIKGYSEAYKEVIHEDAIKIGGMTKAPDYCFRIGGQRKFFVEAKKPSLNLKEDLSPAFQLRRYTWSAKLPLSILTDFEEFAVYDGRIKPQPGDKAGVARILYLTFQDYISRWDELLSLFSPEAILKGGLDRYVESNKTKKGTATVDEAFLDEIELWRNDLAKNIALRNDSLSQRELNYAVQQTIDRIIFLRICEDRGIETYGRLIALQNGNNVYERLLELFRTADERYNSGLFHFRKEKGREDSLDTLTPQLKIDDKTLKDIFKNIYYPSPYEFSVISADILGQIYEQFLGKIIRLTDGHRAVVEDKPEVKKAGGVYYTPTYIVDYIVKNTLEKMLEGKQPKQIKGLTVLDPACGSGSFLILAYQYLLDWYLEKYVKEGAEKYAKGSKPLLYKGLGGAWRLTATERKRILLEHIYGVDIDTQAVEVTKLSLLLKVLEGESGESLQNQLRLFQERALPDLEKNIKCGNSLIGPDFYQGEQMNLLDLDEEEKLRINVFDWQAEFSEIMKKGGFDVVIGNPPYIRIQNLKEWAPQEVEFYKRAYSSASKGNYDIYVVFVEKGMSLLNNKGRLGFILPHKFFNAQYGEPLRDLITRGKHLSHVVHFGDQQIFAGATTYTCLMFLDKGGRSECEFFRVADLQGWQNEGKATEGKIPGGDITHSEWNFTVGNGAALFERLKQMPIRLENVTSRIFQGIKTSADKIYIVEELERKNKQVKIFSPEKQAEYWFESDLLHPLIKGGDSRRYILGRTNRLILFPYLNEGNGAALISETKFKSLYPLTWKYFLDNRKYLEDRENGKMSGKNWYAFGRTQALDVMPFPKIFTPDIATRSAFSLDPSGEVFFTGGVAGGYGVLVSPEYSNEYVLGLLNSKLLEWFVRQIATQMRGGYYSYEARFIRNLPIRTIDFSNPSDKSRHDKIVSLVEAMLSLNKKKSEVRTDHEQKALQRQIDATDRQIDDLVYQLYELTEEEIRIVEDNETK